MGRFRESFTLPASILAAIVLALGCTGNRPPADRMMLGGAPSITSLTPPSGRTGEAYPIQVTVEGSGFAEDGNIVTFGGIPLEALPSTECGTRIRFWVPKEAPSTGEAPPMVLDPGEYEVTVTTPAGTSEPVVFTLTRGT